MGYDVVVEPAAGTGSWSAKLNECIAIDIEPVDITRHNHFLEDNFLFAMRIKKENRFSDW